MTFDLDLIWRIVLIIAAIAWLVLSTPWIRAKIGTEKQKQYKAILADAVMATEQIFIALKKQGEAYTSEDKLEYALNLLFARGLEDSPELRADVEATVYEYTN